MMFQDGILGVFSKEFLGNTFDALLDVKTILPEIQSFPQKYQFACSSQAGLQVDRG